MQEKMAEQDAANRANEATIAEKDRFSSKTQTVRTTQFSIKKVETLPLVLLGRCIDQES